MRHRALPGQAIPWVGNDPPPDSQYANENAQERNEVRFIVIYVH